MDIAVIGLGAIGSQTLLHLTRDPKVRAVGFDLYRPGHGFGASGGENRLFSRAGSDYTDYTRLLDYSLSVWNTLESGSGRTIVEPIGYLAVADEKAAPSHSIIQAAERGGSPATLLNLEQLQDRFGFQRYLKGDIGAFDPSGGMVRTDAAVFEACREAVARGAKLQLSTAVTGIESDGRGVDVRVGSDTHHFDKAIVTIGPWVHQLLPELRDQVQVHRPTSAWFLPRSASIMSGIPAVARDGAQQFYAAPTFDRSSLKVGYSGLRQLEVDNGPHAGLYGIDPADLGEFPEIMQGHLTEFEPVPYRIAQFFEGYTATAKPVIQRISDGVFAAVGFSGLGFKLSPAFGRLVAETALDEDDAGMPRSLDDLELEGSLA